VISFRRRLRPIHRALARLRESFPLTNLGLLIAIASLSAYAWSRVPAPANVEEKSKVLKGIDSLLGQGRADYVVQLASCVALALVAVALLSVVVGAVLTHRAFKKHLERSAERGELGFEARRGFLAFLKMPAFSYLPLIELSWTWQSPEDFAITLAKIDGKLQEHVETWGRQRAEEIVRRFVIEDSFGLARIVLRRSERRIVRVLPWTGMLDTSPMLRSLSGGEDVPHPLGQLTGDRVDIRRYVPGDPLRLMLWKVFARTGELMVRTQERSIAPSVRIVAYLVAALGDEPPAAAARVAIEAGLLGDGWTFSADGANHAATDVDGAIALIVASRHARNTDRGDAAGLMHFLDEACGVGPARVVLFVPAKPGPWLERATAAAKKYGTAMSVLVVTDRVEDPRDATDRHRLDRFLRLPAQADPEAQATTTGPELQEIARAFSSNGAAVLALERPTGKALSQGLRGQIPVPVVRASGGKRVA
jgi:hypothetical protein